MGDKLKRRRSKKTEVEEVENTLLEPVEHERPIRFDKVVSTGSTLLDLAISGGRVRGGGLPGGILVEIFGRPSSGKTAILSEICGSTKGEILFLDPEGRIDEEYSRIYGVELNKDNYYMPQTVTSVFQDYLHDWEPKGDGIHVAGVDSLAALSTDMELDQGDKMGMRRAKEFSQEMRIFCITLRQNNWLLVCTNQVRQSDYGDVTPGGKAIPFYSTVRIKVKEKDKVEKEKSIHVKDLVDNTQEDDEEDEGAKGGKKKKKKEKKIITSKVIGVKSECFTAKNHIDDPYRKVPVYIIFGYGIDDIRGNLQYLKDMTKSSTYDAITKSYQSMDYAVKWIEDNDLEDELREKVIDLWNKIQNKFDTVRKPKHRKK